MMKLFDRASEPHQMLFIGSTKHRKLHRPDCSCAWLIPLHELVEFRSKLEAASNNFTLCNWCFADEPDEEEHA